jgi:putative ABC transport system permease protein
MRLRALVRNLLRREQVERELDDELRGYCELLAAEKIAAGRSAAEARREAMIELGGVEQVKEAVRSVRMGGLVEQLLQDVKYGARILRRTPVFTAVAIATLALGIGANAAIFTVVNAVLLRPLPFGAPEALFAVDGLSYTGEYLELQKRATTFDVAAHEARQSIVTGLGEPLRVPAATVTANLMSLLQAGPALGRVLREGDERADDGEVVVISHAFWRTQFGGDPAVLGRTVTIDGRPRAITGVMPAGFGFPAPETQLWTAAAIDPGNRIALWSTTRRMIARLRPGATLEGAGAELSALGPAMRPLFPWSMPPDYGTGVVAVPLKQSLVSDVRPMLLLLLAAAGLVLLIATVNVSNLLVARTLARGREMGIRAALGAARGRILRQVWTEGLLLVLLGGLAALPLAYAGLGALRSWLPAGMPRSIDLALDLRLLGAGALAVLGAVLIVGGVPALRASNVDLAPRLAESGRHGHGRRTRWTSNVLVGAQMALAIALVITAALLARSLANLYAVTPGFSPDQIVSARISPPAFRYREPAARRAFYASVIERLQTLPGLTTVAVTDRLPFGGEAYGSVFMIEGRPDPRTTGEWPIADVSGIVSPAFFSTLRIPVKEGRTFTAADSESGEQVVVISESLARKYWPGESPVGRRFGFPGDRGPRTIVGVVGDVKWERVTDEGKSALYVPLAQGTPSVMRVVVRSGGDPAGVVEQVRAVVRSLDRDTPVDQSRSMADLIGGSVEGPRLAAMLIGAFALAGLLLGAIGIYGTLSDIVTQRRREIGVRMALGAGRREVYRTVLGGTLTVVSAGAAVGIAGAAVAARFLDTLLFGVTPADPLTFVTAVLLLGVTAAAAAFLPARRATRLDPLVILKVD